MCFHFLINIIVKNNYDSDDDSKGSPNIDQLLEVLQNKFSLLLLGMWIITTIMKVSIEVSQNVNMKLSYE